MTCYPTSDRPNFDQHNGMKYGGLVPRGLVPKGLVHIKKDELHVYVYIDIYTYS